MAGIPATVTQANPGTASVAAQNDPGVPLVSQTSQGTATVAAAE